MIPPSGVPRVREYLLFLKNSWVLVLVTTMACAALSWVSWENSEAEYQSTASVFVRTEGSASPLDAYYGELDMLGLMETYRQLATSSQITAPIIQKLGLITVDATSWKWQWNHYTRQYPDSSGQCTGYLQTGRYQQ